LQSTRGGHEGFTRKEREGGKTKSKEKTQSAPAPSSGSGKGNGNKKIERTKETPLQSGTSQAGRASREGQADLSDVFLTAKERNEGKVMERKEKTGIREI